MGRLTKVAAWGMPLLVVAVLVLAGALAAVALVSR